MSDWLVGPIVWRLPTRWRATAILPSSVGMLVYRDVTSSVTNRVPGGILPSVDIFCRKSVVSLMYDFVVLTRGWRKWSTNCDILSVGQPFADRIGLPGGGNIPL